jgi:hypothetical protein
MTLTLGGPATGRSANPSPAAGHGSVGLTAFTVTSGPGGSTTLTMRKGKQYRLNPTALREALAAHGIPALVTVGEVCSTQIDLTAYMPQVVHMQRLADGTVIIVIDGSKMPSQTRLSIGYFPDVTAMGLVKEGLPLACTSNSPPVHGGAPGTGTR